MALCADKWLCIWRLWQHGCELEAGADFCLAHTVDSDSLTATGVSSDFPSILCALGQIVLGPFLLTDQQHVINTD